MGSLWIGPPGQLREIPDAATDYDRSIELGVSEFRSLGGWVTVTSLATPPRRLVLSFTGLLDGYARWLDALARRVFGPMPLAVVDPTAANLLDGTQSQGYGPLSGYQVIGNGILSHQPNRPITITGTTAGSALRFRHPHWIGWPVAPGQRYGFTSSLAPVNGSCVLDWFDAAGNHTGASAPATAVYDVPPPGTVYARPAVLLQPITAPTPIGTAWLSIGAPAEPGMPAPIGDGCPAMTVTSYADRPRALTRDMSLTLVEVRRATS